MLMYAMYIQVWILYIHYAYALCIYMYAMCMCVSVDLVSSAIHLEQRWALQPRSSTTLFLARFLKARADEIN